MSAKSSPRKRENTVLSETSAIDPCRAYGGRRNNKKSRRVRVYDMPNHSEMREHGATNKPGHRKSRTKLNKLLNPQQKIQQSAICLRRYMEWLGEKLYAQLTYVGNVCSLIRAGERPKVVYILRVKRKAVATFMCAKEALSNMLSLAHYGGLDSSVTVHNIV